jgi:lipopolysaccharide export system protein LptC
MTVEADQLQVRRRVSAAPNGMHDRIVRLLAVALPMAVGVLVAVMVLTPLSPRGEISFLLDRNKVAMVEDRLRVASAMYRGQDDKGRNFSITAGSAVQHTAQVPVVEMKDLVARLLLADGPAVVNAQTGNYDVGRQVVDVIGPVNVETADGYRMTADNVSLDIDNQHLVSHGPVEGRIPSGTFSADRLIADLPQRIVTLDGHARLRMVPGKLLDTRLRKP